MKLLTTTVFWLVFACFLQAQFETVEHYNVINTGSGGISDEWIEEIVLTPNGGLVCATHMGGISLLQEGNWTTYSAGTHWPNPELSNYPSDEIYDLVYDDAGTLWICSFKYLIEYDGADWILHENIERPRKALLDHNGTLWVGTDRSGLFRLENDGSWTNYSTDDGLLQTNVQALAVDNNNNLWIGTFLGLNRFDGTTFSAYTVDNGLAANSVVELTVDPQGRLWVASWRDGISIFDGSNWTYEPDVWNTRDFYLDQDDTLWIAATGSIYAYANDTVVSMYIESDFGEMWDMAFSSFAKGIDGTKYIGTLSRGLIELSPDGSFQIHEPDFGLISNYIEAMEEDSEGRMWLVNSRGLSIYDEDNWTNLFNESLDQNTSFNDVYKDPLGQIWVCARTGALQFDGLNHTLWDQSSGLLSSEVFTMYEDSEGQLWFATGDGVSVFDGSAWMHLTTDNGLEDNRVNHIIEDQSGVIWLAGSDKLYRYTSGNLDVYDLRDCGLFNPFITDLLIDSANDIWISTTRGIARYDGLNWVVYNGSNGLPDRNTSELTLDGDSTIWATTSGGIAAFNGTDFDPYTAENGLLFEQGLTDILFDSDGIIWVATHANGVYLLDQETNVSELERGNTLVLYPNPSQDQVTISSSSAIQEIKIYNGFGQLVYSQNLNGTSQKQMTVRYGLTNGLYLIAVESQDGSFTEKLMVVGGQ